MAAPVGNRVPNFDDQVHNLKYLDNHSLKNAKVKDGHLEKKGLVERFRNLFSSSQEERQAVQEAFIDAIQLVNQSCDGVIIKHGDFHSEPFIIKDEELLISVDHLKKRIKEFSKSADKKAIESLFNRDDEGTKISDDFCRIIDQAASEKLGTRNNEAPLALNLDKDDRGNIIDITKANKDKIKQTIVDLRREQVPDKPRIKELEDALKNIRVQRREIKARVADELGLGVLNVGGATGTVGRTDANRKPLNIIKLDKPDSWRVRFLNFFKRKTVGQLSYLSDAPKAQLHSEVAAYKLSEYFNLGIAPYSTIRKTEDEQADPTKGKLHQTWAQNLDKENHVTEKATSFVIEGVQLQSATPTQFDIDDEDTKTFFQKMVFFEILTGNLDRHADNWIVEVDKAPDAEGKRKIYNLIAIDNANAFPKKFAEKDKVKNQFAWKNLDLAQQSLTDEASALLAEMNEKGIDAFIESIKADPELSNFLDADMERLFKRRFEFLMTFVNQEDTNPAAIVEEFFLNSARLQMELPFNIE